ncbi:MAG: T9SS type A sorting domain-containing protein [Cytophagales bacterium]|jgi:hypothetical protein|nr:T9SS type A sorting domain-containing protein [Cytophagales bacterium]MCA6387536.1 T9SS type A sorting domain-containing protein [Cytophagales bacterium]MCA6391207.1 T9SS type A sorting domain-containing protein [Cytophagales bacterium]MCA6395845.1 T9SS type A sorting domain-containing protein [Cytophagales bacterium]MCA6397648.1 T9SS type A sorting domain-containing protein [Cytophagales bacterium]
MKKKISIGLIFVLGSLGAFSQNINSQSFRQLVAKPNGKIVCFGSNENHPIYLPPKVVGQAGSRVQTADIKVDYVNFPSDAQASFQRAVDIWATLVQSSVRINILAQWVSQDPNVLGSATWGNAFANFDGAPKLNVFYPVALAEKLAGKKLNQDPNPTTGDNYDIYAFFNSSQTRWSFVDSSVPNTYNFTTVVLHEIGHGLGFTDSFDVENGVGSYGVQSTPTPIILDVGVETGAGNRLLNLTNNTMDLNNSLTSNNVSYNPARSLIGLAASKPKLYAPATWDGGSSIAHLDQATYAGSNDRLMRPQLDLGQATLNPGEIVLNMFADMGWVAPSIVHTPLKDTESTSNDFVISVVAGPDGTAGYTINNQLKLRYQINGGTEVELTQVPTTGNQYSFVIPKPTQSVTPTTYNYYLVATDTYTGQNRTFSKPGQIIRPGQPDLQSSFQFVAGPDNVVPVIAHTPKDFISEGTTNLPLKATITDNIAVQGAIVAYKINAGALQNLALVQDNDTLSLYKAAIPTSGLQDGATLSYRITATDNSSKLNQAFAPTATTFYEVAVIGTVPAQNSYANNFNSPTTDFFGNGYTISQPAGFANGAIHSQHPYPEAGTGSLDFSYQLRVPIRVKAQDATIRFDEIVLVEPGEPNSTFGTTEFYDYVVTEGSTDGGKNWKAIGVGYDSRDNTDWLTKYNSSVVNNISQAVGDPTLFKPRTLNLLSSFKAGDEVLIRFRLFSDPGAAGWGWAIDNLKIQIDDVPPILLHDHLNYKIGTATPLSLTVSATDGSGLKTLAIEYKVNNGSIVSVPFTISGGVSQYTLNLATSTLSVGDVIQYRIRSSDNLDNEMVLPSADFLKVPIIALGAAVNQYISDFNSANIDFVGNFFSVSTPSGFSNGAIHSSHPYLNGFGLTNSTSAFTYTLTKPITLGSANPYLAFDEVAIVEPLNDYVNVEGSKDNGTTWQPFLTEYSASGQGVWLTAYSSKSNGTSSLFKSRIVNLLQNGNFKAGDQVLIRFRMNANATVNAWGWAIDNLSIQGPITGIEKSLFENSFSIYPNPTNGSKVTVKFNTLDDTPVQLQFVSAQGAVHQNVVVQPIVNSVEKEFLVDDLPGGLYIIKAEVGGSVITKKFIKSN